MNRHTMSCNKAGLYRPVHVLSGRCNDTTDAIGYQALGTSQRGSRAGVLLTYVRG